MLHFYLESPVQVVLTGEFISPEREWKHLTRTLFEYELMAVTEGTLFIADEWKEHEIKAGEYLIMSPNRFQHGTKTCKCRFYWLHFSCPALPASLSIPAHGKIPDMQSFSALFLKLFEADTQTPHGIRARYLATELLLELAKNAPAEEREEISAQRALCEKVKTFVAWHRFSDVRVKEIARELGYHEKYLSAVFSATEGKTLKRYLAEERLKEAKRLLLDTNATVAEIAFQLAFPSPNNFSRFFKNETGLTAAQYRRQESKP